MNEYQNLLNACSDIGDTANTDHFSEASTIAQRMNISKNKFAQLFNYLPKVKSAELKKKPTNIAGVFANCYGILVVNMNQTAKDAFNKYLNANAF